MWSGDQGLNDPTELEDPEVILQLLEEEKNQEN